MNRAGVGHIRANDHWIADVFYDITTQQVEGRPHQRVRVVLRRGRLMLPHALATLELICADNSRYRVTNAFTLDARGWYVTMLPQPDMAQSA